MFPVAVQRLESEFREVRFLLNLLCFTTYSFSLATAAAITGVHYVLFVKIIYHRQNHNCLYENQWNYDGAKNAKGLNGHNSTSYARCESSSRRQRSHEHSLRSFSKGVCQSLFYTFANQFDFVRTNPEIMKYKHVIGTDADDHDEDGNVNG